MNPSMNHGILAHLQQLSRERIIRPLDYQFARYLALHDADPLLALVAALISAEAGNGHVCLDLRQLNPTRLFGLRDSRALWHSTGGIPTIEWPARLQHCMAVGDGRCATPLVLNGDYLYLHRLWQDEGLIVEYLQQSENRITAGDQAQTDNITAQKAILDRLFGQDDTVNWQKVAAAIACNSRMSVISGGPGTGKTTTVTRLLAALLLQESRLRQEDALPQAPQSLRIKLVAPTGKAAARLSESISAAREKLPVAVEIQQKIPTEAGTLHRLLGAQPNSSRYRHHKDNRLHLDLLVVDEASMVDLSLMARLVEALPDHARLILLGDRHQLASVEAGAVLGDICRLADQGYSLDQAQWLSAVIGSDLIPYAQDQGDALRDQICLLRKSYRFDDHSGIGVLASKVNQGDSRDLATLFSGQYPDIQQYPLDAVHYSELLKRCVQGYRAYLIQLRSRAEQVRAGVPDDQLLPIRDILHTFAGFQLLCALREGPFGVGGLNSTIERELEQAKLIQRDDGNRWYEGRPIMIMQNDSVLGLFNGDIGMTLADTDQQGRTRFRVCFEMPDGSIKSFLTSRLPAHETVFAMTVHKSQGSEFAHTVLVLPDKHSPLLSRELVYTAITRAKQQLVLYTDMRVLQQAINTPTVRRSGFSDRLMRTTTPHQ
ncbi:MAG: exodeoxyribonuclease V subunit alpha [Plesiomonas sp.]